MFRVSDEEFEEMVEDAIDSIPERFLDELENVAFVVEDEPEDGSDLLGFYDGVSLVERGDGYGGLFDYPDTIVIYQGPHERACDSRAQLAEEVRRTVVHEVGHYFGMSEEQITAMGYE